MTYNLIGKTFGHLKVLKKVANDYQGKNQWLCECACGNQKVYITNMLTGKRGATTCRNCKDYTYKKEAYGSWQAARQRCLNKTHKDYPRYGGAGIIFSPAWNDFKVFYAELGDPPWDDLYQERYSLDRIDNTKGYEPGNCRWATREQQANNKKDSKF